MRSSSFHDCYHGSQDVFQKGDETNPADTSSNSSECSEDDEFQDAVEQHPDMGDVKTLEELGLSQEEIHKIQLEDTGRGANAEEEKAFLEECERLGICKELAEEAAKQSRETQSKWWTEMQKGQLQKKKRLNQTGGNEEDDILKGEELSMCNIMMTRQGSQLRLETTMQSELQKASILHLVKVAKHEALKALKNSQGDTTSPRFQSALNALAAIYQGNGFSLQSHQSQVQFEGNWVNVSRPNFPNCLGNHPKSGHFMYTLGRMSFDMFRPLNLRCSIQKVMCKTRPLDAAAGEAVPREVPRSLKQQIQEMEEQNKTSSIRTYDIEVSFTIEPRSLYETQPLPDGTMEDVKTVRAPSTSIKAKMTSFGYLLPDPGNPIRFTVWFTGGVVAPVQQDPCAPTSTSKSSSSKSSSKSSASSSSKRDKFRTSGPPGRRKPASCVHEDEEVDLPTCTLSLPECRRRKKVCLVHNIDRPSMEDKSRFRKMNDRYARPSHGLYSRACQTNTLLMGPSTLGRPFSAEWEDLFAPEENWKRNFSDHAKALAVKLLMGATLPEGMEDDGTMEFTLSRPIGGHGTTFVDVLYMDENLRILKGNAGTIFVQAREGKEKQAISSKLEDVLAEDPAMDERESKEEEPVSRSEREDRRSSRRGVPSKPSKAEVSSRERHGRRRGPIEDKPSPLVEEDEEPVRRNSAAETTQHVVNRVLYAIQRTGSNVSAGSNRSIGSNRSVGAGKLSRQNSSSSLASAGAA